MSYPVPKGWALVPLVPTDVMVQLGTEAIENNGGNARWADMRESWDSMLTVAPKFAKGPVPDGFNEVAYNKAVEAAQMMRYADVPMSDNQVITLYWYFEALETPA